MPERAAAADVPRHASLLVATTWHCNLSCSYCFVESSRQERDEGRMPPRVAARVVDALDEAVVGAGPILIHLYGGEPLTNLPALAAMVGRARSMPAGRVSFGITTNGTIASAEAIDLLGAGEFEISLSIDGPPEIHDLCRRTPDGSPTHERVLEFLRLVKERTRCRIRGSSVIRSGWRLADACSYLLALGVETYKAQVVRVPPGSRFALSPEERGLYLEDLEHAADGVITALEAGRMPEDGRFTGRVLQLLAGHDRRPSFCDVGSGTFGVLPSGHVVPCVLIHPVERILGHIDDDPRTWLEDGKRWREERQLRTECRACDRLDLCGGGCPAIMPVCGSGECEFIRKECELTERIYERFRHRPETLLALAGVT